ncbi:MAG TPA: DUF2076 domain-containing protein [Xanthobacteraceae bacterium]
MTPQERELIADLFDRLAQLEGQPRDAEAERAIGEGLARAPHAIYPLVQTVLVQDEALKAANAHIQALEGGTIDAGRPSGFLDNMREALFGRSEPRRGSVPSVQPGFAAAPPQNAYAQPYAQGPSFLGTAAAAAAGMVGGALLLDGMRSMLGGHRHGPFAATFDELHAGPRAEEGSPWRGGSDELARQAGLDDIGRGPDHGNEGGAPQGFMDAGQDDAGDAGDPDFADDGGFDDGGDGGLDSA